jgi:transaldolase/glucose-6-phosphate isomerase
MTNPIVEAGRLGQSFWYDTLSRALLASGELRAMVEQDGIAGVTSNPTIFEKAMDGSTDYDPSLRALVGRGVRDPKTLYEQLAVEDIRGAAELLHPTYVRTAGADGFVSLEVSPHLAHDTEGSVAEARRLFRAVDRENIMIKLPGTREAAPAIERLTAEGVNVNVTLLFGLGAYRRSAEAFVAGLERLTASGGDPGRVASVASFFLSRIDAAVEERVAAQLARGAREDRKRQLESLPGKVAIANAKLAYVDYQELVASERWKALAARGARPQRLLWASTGTKNPAYPKTLYVDALIGPNTVNTVPAETFRAFREQGRPRSTLAEGVPEARATMKSLAEAGISIDEVTDGLLEKGIASFSSSFDTLLGTLERKRQKMAAETTASPSAPA